MNQIRDMNKEKYQFGEIGWSNTKFSELILWELYDWREGEL